MTLKTLCLILGFLISSCSSEIKKDIMKNKPNPTLNADLDFSKLETMKIYFGHQSVGYNLIDGIEYELKQMPEMNFNVIELEDPLNVSSGLSHSRIGKNRNPKSKIDDFKKLVEAGLGENVDVAGFKFCYVDINSETNINDLFLYYRSILDGLANKYPKVKFIHFTVPIKTIQKGPKGIIKRILGRDMDGENNLARQKFSQLLLEEYDENSIFDIAKFESSFPDGKRNSLKINNEITYFMVNEYSNDGGHLSEYGKKYMGSQFLLFFVNITNGR